MHIQRIWPSVLYCIAFLPLVLHGRPIDDRKCDFAKYRPLKLGILITGGYEGLATEKVEPTYPDEAQKNGIGGRVDAQVLVNRTGDVVSVCAVGEPLLVASVEEAVSRWKFQKDFGFGFVGDHPGRPEFALLELSFNFKPTSESFACSMQLKRAKETGLPVKLSSRHLIRIAITKVVPKTPSICRCEGVVRVRLLVDVNGIVKCMDPGTGHPLLIYSALEALRQWRFQPLVHKGVPVPYVGELSVRFSIGRTGVFAE